LSERYIETLRSHLLRFAAVFHNPIVVIKTAEIERWLREQKVGGRARNNIRGSVVTLFHFARKQGDLPKGSPTEADDVAKAKDRGGNIGILSPSDLALLMKRAPERVRLFVAIGAFTGMRSSEILRLDWDDVNFERSFITVAAEKAKTATRRLVPMQPNLMQWLAPYHGRRGAIFKTRRDAARAIAFAKRCKIAWPNNALRHSYATYRLALTADAARVALEMGNSPQKLMTNYRELAHDNEAKEWFGVSPQNPANVIFVPSK
jgi:integrase